MFSRKVPSGVFGKRSTDECLTFNRPRHCKLKFKFILWLCGNAGPFEPLSSTSSSKFVYNFPIFSQFC